MLNILHLEDNSRDAAFLADLLHNNLSCNIHRVFDKTEFERSLGCYDFDIILSTFALPSFSGSEALQIVRKQNPDIPFLFLSMPIGEPAAVECIKKGATDFLLKQAPERIIPAISRALDEATRRRAQAEYFIRNGVAHDINNVLLPIVMAAEMLQANSSASDRDDWIDIILSSAQRGVDILQRMAQAKNIGRA